ncbi:MAG: membrane lipoprotein lipid attachment site-containing protein [Ruminococcus sp.]|nr:membrane lipoprotein lipid attachment site-containing protein [Ruminococcus sp.]
MKKFLFFVILIVLLVSGCSLDINIGNNQETYCENSESLTVDVSYFPDFEVSSMHDNTVYYMNVTSDMLDDYINFMVADGFECKRNMYDILLYKEDVMIQITDNTNSINGCSVTGYTAVNFESEGALTGAETLNIIDDEAVFYLLERTPDGFFEATGAQYFFAPVHRFEYDENISKIPENTGYINAKIIVSEKGSVYINNAISSPKVCDINEDGITDIIVLGYGPTSGIFTITISVINIIDGVPVVKCSGIFTIEHGNVDVFLNDTGKPMLAYKPNEAEEYSVYEIRYDGLELKVDNLPITVIDLY